MIGLTILLRVFKAVPTANISFYLNNTKMHNINHSERLPYEKLAALGIDREKADSLPQEVKEKLAQYLRQEQYVNEMFVIEKEPER